MTGSHDPSSRFITFSNSVASVAIWALVHVQTTGPDLVQTWSRLARSWLAARAKGGPDPVLEAWGGVGAHLLALNYKIRKKFLACGALHVTLGGPAPSTPVQQNFRDFGRAREKTWG